MAKSKKGNPEDLTPLFLMIGGLLFLPFMIFTFMHYRKLKKAYLIGPNVQRVFDVGLLRDGLISSAVFIAVCLIAVYFIDGNIIRVTPKEYIDLLIYANVVIGVMALYPLKKMAERVAVIYFGVVFDDYHKKIVMPADLSNASFGDYIRMLFIRRMGDCDEISINAVTGITRERGVNLYIHGAFGSRRIYFTNKQKRDECITALQARKSVRLGGDHGY